MLEISVIHYSANKYMRISYLDFRHASNLLHLLVIVQDFGALRDKYTDGELLEQADPLLVDLLLLGEPQRDVVLDPARVVGKF